MEVQRAKEISQSPTIAKVLYNGQSVYIQHVDEKNKKARIYPLDDPNKEQDVSLADLIEQRIN